MQGKGGCLVFHAMEAVLQLMKSHGFYSAGPELGKSCSVLQRVCSMCGGFGLVQDHGLGHLGMF